MGIGGDKFQQGFSTAVSPLAGDLLKADSRPLEPALQEEGNYFPAPKKIPFKRYYDEAFAELEMEKLWKRSWQVVGREEDIPEVGDRKPYDVGQLSYIIIRSGKDEFRALQNACLHRGTRLCHGPTGGGSIRCPFHAWEWNVDGSLKNLPGRWDFQGVKDEEYALPEARIDRWGGFLFINPDPHAGPLVDALGILPAHFEKRDGEDRYTAAGFRKKLRCNWKAAQDAFLEAYHLSETHPEAVGFAGDTQTRYDIWQDAKSQVSRLITPGGVPSGTLGDGASRIAAAEQLMQVMAMGMPDMDLPPIRSHETGRAEVAEWRRQTMGPALGVDLSDRSDSFMLDSTQYFAFPNFWPWFGEGLPLTYQFTPYGTDPNECVVEFRLTLPVPQNGPRPPAAELVELDFDTPCTTVKEMGFIASVFDQDFSNLPLVQVGLRSTRNGDGMMTLGRYQEARIVAFHEMLERTLGI